MSLESLLDELEVPSVPLKNNVREPRRSALDQGSSLGSPGSLENVSCLEEPLATACLGQSITSLEVRKALEPEDIKYLQNGEISNATLAAFTRSLVQRREMDQGKRPDHYNEHPTCQHCGPIWLWFSGKVAGCPWCWNRVADKPIPRPCSVRCGACNHFERVDHPHLGHCTKGESEAIAGLWDADHRGCSRYLPLLLKQE